MKRDVRLRDLSDDHHQALVLARRAARAATGDGAESLDVWSEVASRLARFGELLRAHVRFEERVLFVVAQETLGDAVLDAVAEACRKLRGSASPVRPSGSGVADCGGLCKHG